MTDTKSHVLEVKKTGRPTPNFKRTGVGNEVHSKKTVEPHDKWHTNPFAKKYKEKVHKVMGEYKRGTLHSGSKKGPEVHGRKQAIAIALSEAQHGKKK